MYIPKPFLVDDPVKLYDFIERNSFGLIVSMKQEGMTATHMPFVLDREEGCLYGHFAKPNPQWEEIENQDVLVVFSGPHAYISSSWYETNQSVPTWNYVAVHAYGSVEKMDDQAELIAALNRLVVQYEGPDSAYRLDETNQAYVEGLSRGIVGFKLNIRKLEGKWKLSQNHSVDRQRKVIERLESSQSEDARKIAALMKRNVEEERT